MLIERNESGQAAVEFALVLPVFILMLFAVIESGMFFLSAIKTEFAACEGARTASLCCQAMTLEEAAHLAEDIVYRNTGDQDGCTVNISYSGDSVRVEVTRNIKTSGIALKSLTGGTYSASYTAVLPPDAE